ncbi:folate-binding protein [Luteimonas sp. 8-5]|uniref:CAF17-like 4Fe-4S cluster assembly/insertion protein YgfZ n=1 Tax=Luteimonas sp. 8-5 TaxID=3039387 RepID=UPI00243661BA|nr:folate-binding protein [Luteimonas sp. 8-5]MDG6348332.1 folate-binding protein [Luteimonas sp. 8-5]
MPDKLQPWFALPGHAVVTLEGRDALAFAHAQFMNDSRPLADGQWQWSGWLSPKGRVLALFVFLRRGPECAWLVLPDADAQGFADALKRFVFRSKVAIDVRDDLHVSGCFGDIGACGSGGSREALIPFAASAAPTDMRMIRISEEPGVPDDDAVARWTIADLRAGIPRLPASQHDKWTPQQLSLDRLDAYSVKKGCYPGQEIVARTHFLGKAKRGLVVFTTTTDVAPGDPMPETDGNGEIVAVATLPDGTRLAQAIATL